jgi:hypothetical protein
MSDRAPPASTPAPVKPWRSRFFEPLPVAPEPPSAQLIAFPRERIVRRACPYRLIPGDRVSLKFTECDAIHTGSLTSIDFRDGSYHYTVLCDDGITRGIEVPL